MIENSAKREENRREDKRAGKKYIVILIVCSFIGMLVGLLGGMLVNYMKVNNLDFISFSKMVTELWLKTGMYSIIVVNALILPLLWYFFVKHRKELRAWDGEDEYVYEKIDKKLSTGMTVSAGLMVFDMLTYGVGFYGAMNSPAKMNSWIFLVDLVFFIGSFVCIMFYQKALVNLLKELHPEKQGSVYDTKFHKKWLDSCDEAEKQKIGEACYATYSFMNLIYELVAMVFMIAGFFFPIGVLPLTTVCLLWMLQIVFYSVKAR